MDERFLQSDGFEGLPGMGEPVASRRRVGIVTIVGGFNYGNRLQNYAMERVWAQKGFSPVTLRYGEPDAYHRIRHAIGAAARRLANRPCGADPESLVTPARARAFARFDSLMHIERVERPLAALAGRFDLFSAGSDQCWNPGSVNPEWYFLSFAPREKRVALCPGLGVREAHGRCARSLRRGLANFDRLSVREEDGARLIKMLTGRYAEVLSDPTLMLDAGEWRSLSRPVEGGPSCRYAFCYLLGGATPERDGLLASVRAEGLEVVQMSDCDDSSQLPAGPAEWLHLVDKAEVVVTDSFHACAFAILFGRPLVLVPRKGGEGMSGRFDTLIGKLGLAKRDSEFGWGTSLDATPSTLGMVAAERDKFASYMETALSDLGIGVCGLCGNASVSDGGAFHA